jgi:hypothetical protein
MHIPDDKELQELDFAWAMFFIPILEFELRVQEHHAKGIPLSFNLIDHQNGRSSEQA